MTTLPQFANFQSCQPGSTKPTKSLLAEKLVENINCIRLERVPGLVV